MAALKVGDRVRIKKAPRPFVVLSLHDNGQLTLQDVGPNAGAYPFLTVWPEALEPTPRFKEGDLVAFMNPDSQYLRGVTLRVVEERPDGKVELRAVGWLLTADPAELFLVNLSDTPAPTPVSRFEREDVV